MTEQRDQNVEVSCATACSFVYAKAHVHCSRQANARGDPRLWMGKRMHVQRSQVVDGLGTLLNNTALHCRFPHSGSVSWISPGREKDESMWSQEEDGRLHHTC